jgi:hypothetical protein
MKKFKEHAQLDEAPYVASDSDILDSVWKEVKKVLEKELKKGQTELTNIVARIGKYKITKDSQQKGKSFRMDLKR